MAVKNLSDRDPDGTSLGQDADDLVGFHGAVSDQDAVFTANATTAATTTTPWGFTTSTQANKVISDVSAIRTALINKGIIAAS